MAWRTVRDELIGLFIDDGSFAAAILAWLAGGLICLRLFMVPPEIEAIVLAVGFGLLLAENVARTAGGDGRS